MFSIFTKKKITEETLANIFVNGIIKLVEDGFPELADMINNDPEFQTSPKLLKENYDKFLLIVFTGNLSFLPDHFNAVEQMKMQDRIYAKFSSAIGLSKAELKTCVSKNSQLFYTLNHPSKNVKYAMSKAFFHQYELYKFQDSYFRKMRVPNPILLKRLNDVIETFVWDWDNMFKRYRAVFT